VPYGTVIELMAKIKKLGVENVGLITEPETRL
jgi:biopolymer transport protein ExbD